MKTSWKKNKKFWTAALAVVVSISCLLGLWTVVYAHEQSLTETLQAIKLSKHKWK